jgi:hypothetical protein
VIIDTWEPEASNCLWSSGGRALRLLPIPILLWAPALPLDIAILLTIRLICVLAHKHECTQYG